MGNEKIKARMDLISKELSKEAAGHLIIAIAEIVKKAREETLEEVHNKLDDLNGERGDLCLFCDACNYNGKEGVLHRRKCIIVWLRHKIEKLKSGGHSATPRDKSSLRSDLEVESDGE